MTLQQVGFNTFGGVNRTYKVIECSNIFFKGRVIHEQFANNECYISWSGANKNDYESNWADFLNKWKIQGDIETIPLKINNQKQ